MLYDLTSLQRDANTRFGFSARRTLGGRAAALRGAQGAHLPAHQLALPDERHGRARSSRRPSCSRAQPVYAAAARVRDRRSTCCRSRASSTTRRSPTTTRSSRRAPSTRSTRWTTTTRASTTSSCGASSPPSTPRRCSRTRASRRPSPSTSSARAARCCSCRAGAACTCAEAEERAAAAEGDEDEPREPGAAARSTQGEPSRVLEVESLAKETKPPRRYSDASLLGAMETAGKLVDDEELREAMKDSGIGTPATRAAIIERLIDVGYVERDGRALRRDREGAQRDPPARRAPADLARPDRRAGSSGSGGSSAARTRASASCATSPGFATRDRRGARRDAQGRAHPARDPRAVPGLRPRDRREPQGLLVLAARRSRAAGS